MLRCVIRNVEYEITEGAVFTENYNETLDSGTILIQQLSSEIDIEPYDIVEITDDNNRINARIMCVDTFTKTQTSLNPPIYEYEIHLFSETKLLEGIICPNLSITKVAYLTPRTPWDPTTATRKTVYDYISQYVNLYSTKTSYNTNYILWTNKFSLASRLSTKFNMECPEMQWNEPTLREVLNDLMMVADCIPVVHNNVIDYIDLSEIGSEISNVKKNGINYIQETQTSDDYVSNIKMHLVNASNNSVPSDNLIPDDATEIVEKIGFRNNESYLLTTENILLQTSYPIWKLFYCKMYYKVLARFEYTHPSSSSTMADSQWFDTSGILKDDTIDYILEYTKWLTKDVWYGAWSNVNSAEVGKYRNTSLYYVRGEKNIRNFNDKATSSILWIDRTQYVLEKVMLPSLTQAIQDYLDTIYPDGEAQITQINADLDFKECEFEVKYETIDDFVFSASKMPMPRNYRQIIDNQTNSYVDINKQGMLEYFKANRLGNKISMINGRYYTTESNIPALSEKINNKIIFKKQISVYNAYIGVNYWATDNYVLQNYFTGVKSKIRSWRIVSGQEALVRSDLIKLYVNEDIEPVISDYYKIPVYTDLNDYINNFKYCCLQFRMVNMEAQESYYPMYNIRPYGEQYQGVSYNTNAIQTEFTKHLIKDKNGNIKSVIFTIKLNDNYYAGNYVSNYSGTDGRVEQKGIAYADLNGEVLGCYICFYSAKAGSLSNAEADRALKPLTNIGMNTTGTATGTVFSSENLVAKIPFLCYKDNREILQISIQFEWNAQANDMFIGVVESE